MNSQVKQELARVNINILVISEQSGPEWANLIQMTIISTTVGKNLLEETELPSQSTRVQNAVLGCNLKNDRMISVHFQGKAFNITVIKVYASTTNAKEAEVEWFYEDLQDFLELTPTHTHTDTHTHKDVLFIIGDLNAKVRSQEIPGVTGKFGLGVQNEAGQRLTVLPRECTGYSKHPLPTT